MNWLSRTPAASTYPPRPCGCEWCAEWWQAAVHEAGHVVAHLVTGIPFHIARLTERPVWWGEGVRVGGYIEAGQHSGRTGDELDAYIVVGLAGPYAEQRVTGHRNPRACRGDERDVRRFLRQTGMTREQAQHRAEVLVGQHWGGVLRVAEHLFTHGHITSPTARHLT